MKLGGWHAGRGGSAHLHADVLMESNKYGLISPLKLPVLPQLIEGILAHNHLRTQQCP